MTFADLVAADPDAPAVDDLTRRRTAVSSSTGPCGWATGSSTTAASQSTATWPCFIGNRSS